MHATAVDSSRPAGDARQPHGILEVLRRQLVPGGGPRPTRLEPVIVFLIAAPLAFFRLGAGAIHARVWAEDGKIFLQQAMTDGPVRAMTISYAGYGHGVPRLAAAAVYPFPVRWWGAGLHVADSLVVAGVAVVVYLGLSDHLRSRAGRAVAAGYVVLIPVGPEITGSIANLQWYLVVAGAVALFWTPTTRSGWLLICAATLAITTSSVLGAPVWGCAVIKWVLQRRGHGRGPLVVLIVTTAGFAAQAVEVLHSPQRKIGDLYAVYGAGGLARGYLKRVVGDGVLGIDRLHNATGTSVLAGSVVMACLAGVIVLGLVQRWTGPWAAVGVLIAFSIATYLTSVLLQPSPLPMNVATYASRYYVPPTLFFVLGLIVLGGGLVERHVTAGRHVSTRRAPATAGERGARGLLSAVVLVLVGTLAFTTVSNYYDGDRWGRDNTPTWSHAVLEATHACRQDPGRQHAKVVILPVRPTWEVRFRCRTLISG